jgi:hypothetical protein
MNRVDFQELTRKHFNEIMGLNTTKGHDYAGDSDALANFKSAAKRLDLTPEQVWAVYADKHWSAIMTYCAEGEVASEPIEGRIHDVILYCFLQLGLIEERKQAQAVSDIDNLADSDD